MAEIIDVAPELLDRVQKTFSRKVESNREIKRILQKLEDGTADMVDAANYARAIGESLAAAFATIKAADLPDGRMYYNIANRVIRNPLEEADVMVEDVAGKIMALLNKKAGIGLKVII